MKIFNKFRYMLYGMIVFCQIYILNACSDNASHLKDKVTTYHFEQDKTSKSKLRQSDTSTSDKPRDFDEDIVLDNSYLKITKKRGEKDYRYQIKQPSTKPVVVLLNGTVEEKNELAIISYQGIQGVEYVLLPQSHWFSQQFLNNPFKDIEKLSLTRPSINGFSLEFITGQNSMSLWRRGKEVNKLSPKVVQPAELEQIFPGYNKKLLGEGGESKVYQISYKGKEYALKEKALEVWDLERLQFSNAVVKTFASFSMNGETHLLMEKGIKDLKSMNESKEKLSKDQLLDAVKKFTQLISIQKSLGISNKDIKDRNIILDQDNKLKIIDISSTFTRGYHGTNGQLFARVLLENIIGRSLAGGYVSLDRYFQFSDPKYREGNIASEYLLSFWYPMVCKEEKVSVHDERCNNVASFAQMFLLFSPAQLKAIGLKNNEHFIGNDISGTNDEGLAAPYKTGLPYPNLSDDHSVNWQAFFNKKSEIGKTYCSEAIANSRSPHMPGAAYYSKYERYCKENPAKSGDYNFVLNFAGAHDKNFKEWILDAYSPYLMRETFEFLARKYPISLVYPSILRHELDINEPNGIGKALWDLYHYKP
ncbi:MAG: protein kinase family protein [Myxococcales bacterium]|nr:protein kinase family protein [Myxococcales bacterium]USN50556.1 MAG: protein kinase family protein [Myxococcales bacterium]